MLSMGELTANVELTEPFRNRYFALRHGESEANVAGIIISDPDTGVKEFGLTEEGREAVRQAARAFAERLKQNATVGSEDLRSRVVVIASDFKRTRETAELFAETLGGEVALKPIRLEVALRERWFGELEAGPNNRYQDVWEVDGTDPESTPFSAESAVDVQRRTAFLIQ